MKKTFLILLAVMTLSISESYAQTATEFFSKTDALLSQHVSNGSVDYKAIANDPTALNDALALAKDLTIPSSDAKTYQAFWINAYNLSVIKGIIDHYPIKSPLDKSGFFDKTKHAIGGTSITLNDIENKKLRAQFNDARFHFVLVCGAKGCPPLIAKAYTASNLESLLQKQTVTALNDPNFIRVKGKKVAFSEIFKWYKEDFVSKGSDEIDFLNKYRKEPVAEGSKVTYYSYDWRLNSK